MKDNPPIASLIQRRRAGRGPVLILLMLYVVTLGAFSLLYLRLAEAFESRPRFIICTDPGTQIISHEQGFMEAKTLHVAQAELAMQTLFNRGPKGLDNDARAKRLFGKAAYQKLRDISEAQAPEFDAKNLHQKVEIASVELVRLQNRSVKVAVYGQLIRTGHFAGQPFNEALAVKASLLFVHNPSILENGRYPTVATEFEIETEPIPAQ